MCVCCKSPNSEIILPQNNYQDGYIHFYYFLSECVLPKDFLQLVCWAQEPHSLQFLVIISYVSTALYDLSSNFLQRLSYFIPLIARWGRHCNFFFLKALLIFAYVFLISAPNIIFKQGFKNNSNNVTYNWENDLRICWELNLKIAGLLTFISSGLSLRGLK